MYTHGWWPKWIEGKKETKNPTKWLSVARSEWPLQQQRHRTGCRRMWFPTDNPPPPHESAAADDHRRTVRARQWVGSGPSGCLCRTQLQSRRRRWVYRVSQWFSPFVWVRYCERSDRERNIQPVKCREMGGVTDCRPAWTGVRYQKLAHREPTDGCWSFSCSGCGSVQMLQVIPDKKPAIWRTKQPTYLPVIRLFVRYETGVVEKVRKKKNPFFEFILLYTKKTLQKSLLLIINECESMSHLIAVVI